MHINTMLVQVHRHVFQFLQVLGCLLALLLHYRIGVDNAVGHFHVAQILEEVLYLVVVSAQVYLLSMSSLGTHSLVAYLVHYYHTAYYLRTCLFEHDVGQLYLRTHYGGLLALNPFVKLLVCRTSRNKCHNTTAFLQVLECLAQVSNGCCTGCTERWVHHHNVVLVADVVVLEYGVLELSAQTACLQLQLREQTLARLYRHHLVSLRRISCYSTMARTRFQHSITLAHVRPFHHLVAQWLRGREVVHTLSVARVQLLVRVVVKHSAVKRVVVLLLGSVKLLSAYALLLDRHHAAMLQDTLGKAVS